MNYGYFDLENKEYVITRPDTPAPWVNYLGSPEYGAIISKLLVKDKKGDFILVGINLDGNAVLCAVFIAL